MQEIMPLEEAIKIVSSVTSAWQRLPRDQRGPGSKKALALQIYVQLKPAIPFDEWFAAVWSMVSRSGKYTETGGEAGMPKGENGDKTPYIERYRQLALKRDVLPDDDLLSELWGCARDGTLASARSRLKERGFDFDLQPDKQFKVVKRPRPQTHITAAQQRAVDGLLEPDAPTKTPGQIAIEHLIDVTRQEFAVQNIRINELAQMVAELVQIERQLLEVIQQAWK